MGRLFLNLLWIILLTAITQIGGIIYIIATLFFRKNRFKKWSAFIIVYLIATFLIVPNVAPIFGREKIKTNKGHNKFFIDNSFGRSNFYERKMGISNEGDISKDIKVPVKKDIDQILLSSNKHSKKDSSKFGTIWHIFDTHGFVKKRFRRL